MTKITINKDVIENSYFNWFISFDCLHPKTRIETNETFDLSDIGLGICKPVGEIFQDLIFNFIVEDKILFENFINDPVNHQFVVKKVFKFFVGNSKFLAMDYGLRGVNFDKNEIEIYFRWMMYDGVK